MSVLVSEKKPEAICLQDIFVKDIDSRSLKYHSCYHKTSDASARACSGVVIVVKHSVPHSLISLTTTLQATSVRISSSKTITLCSLYLPSSQPLDTEKLVELVN